VAFSEVNIVPQFETGVLDIAQANGFAGMNSNTLMFGWPENHSGAQMLLRVMRAISQINKSTILARLPQAEGPAHRQRIDVWWGGLQNNGDMMLLLAYLLSINPEWRQARITVRSIVSTEEERKPAELKLEELVTEARIDANTDVILKPADQAFLHVMHSASEKADVVFLGLKIPKPREEEQYAKRLMELAGGFRATVFVRNSEPFAGELI
jgi:hypothetical protein